jgi:hypothetical protein
LLAEIAPAVKRAAIIFDPDTASGGGSLLPTRIRGGCPIAQGENDEESDKRQ